jgi:hypothetical protein
VLLEHLILQDLERLVHLKVLPHLERLEHLVLQHLKRLEHLEHRSLPVHLELLKE